VSDKEHATGEVDVLCLLVEKLSPAHPRIERSDDEVPQVRRGRIEKCSSSA
jgi:hypothetical protein